MPAVPPRRGRAVQCRERRLCWADRLPFPRIGAAAGSCPRETRAVPVFKEAL
jgi:hypothetical protein